MIRSLLISLALTGAASTVWAQQWLDAPDGLLQARDINRVLAEHPLAPGENIRVIPLARTEQATQALVQVRDREPLHYHADSDLTVFVLRGAGALRLGARELPVRAGDVLHVPRGMVHAYINHGAQPGVALVVMSPPPGPDDRVPVPASPAR